MIVHLREWATPHHHVINLENQRHFELNTHCFNQKQGECFWGRSLLRNCGATPASFPSTHGPSLIHLIQVLANYGPRFYIWSVKPYNMALQPNLNVYKVIVSVNNCISPIFLECQQSHFKTDLSRVELGHCRLGLIEDWWHLILLDFQINTFCCRINTLQIEDSINHAYYLPVVKRK